MGFTIFAAISGGAPVKPRSEASGERIDDLDQERERLYAELVELERARHEAAVDPDAYAQKRSQLTSRLVMIHRELDKLRAVRPGKRRRAT